MLVALKKFIIFFQTSHHLPDLPSERIRYTLKFIQRENKMQGHPQVHYKTLTSKTSHINLESGGEGQVPIPVNELEGSR